MKPILVDFDSYAAATLVFSDDENAKCLDANDDVYKRLGLKDVQGKTLDALFPGETRASLKKKSDLAYKKADGSEVRFRPYVGAVEHDGQKAWALILIDNTDIIESSAQLGDELEQQAAIIEMKSNFLATMSHEIRTPMQAVYGLLELIGEEKPEKKIMDMVLTAKESASGLLEILDEILDLAKLDAHKMELDDFEVPIRLMARGTLEAMSVKKGGPQVEVIDDIDQSVPFVVKGDPKRLRQIIMNFVSNALKFTKKGHVKLNIHTKVQHIKAPDGGVALRFEVEDTGMGMPEEVCKKLFQAFVQADSSTARKFGGTGLGLSICKKLVELMNGVIGVDSVEGQGSTFWFEIPTFEVATDQTSVELPNLDGIAVLSVEDHPQGGKEIMNSLQSMGAKVTLVTNYADGLDMVKRRPFDVIIADQGLPDGLGLDLLKEASEIRPFMGQIMYTVRDDYGLQHSCKSIGATYLVKPASRAGLGEAVKELSSNMHFQEIEGPKRLLIAEDTESVREIIQKQLALLGADADFVEDGRAALDAMATGKYGILITDLHMPEVDGYQVIREIRQQDEFEEKHTPVIVLTADVQMAQRQTYLNEGFDECLLKPVSLGQFRHLLIRWGLLKPDAGEAQNDDVEQQAHEPAQSSEVEDNIIDLKAMEAQMGEVNADTLAMVGMFVDMTAPVIEKIKEAYESGDLVALAEAAHSLKGSARSACCVALGDVAADLQEEAERKNKDQCALLVPQIGEQYARILPALEKLS